MTDKPEDTPSFHGMMIFNGDYPDEYDEQRLENDG
jgi:hypothetical protein